MSINKELKILYQLYWNSIGWNDKGTISQEDFLQVKKLAICLIILSP